MRSRYYYCGMVFKNKYGDVITIRKKVFCEEKELGKYVGTFISELREKNILFSEYYFEGWEILDSDPV